MLPCLLLKGVHWQRQWQERPPKALKYCISETPRTFLSSRTCGKASGRDSKMTISTPIGTVFWTKSKVSDTFVCRTTLPTMLWLELVKKKLPLAIWVPLGLNDILNYLDSAIWLRPFAKDCSFPWVRASLDNRAGDVPAFLAAATST